MKPATIKLSSRLETLKSFHQDAPVVWDIGCDHGLLGLSFVHGPLVEEINLVDPSVRVIETLQSKLKDSYITIPKPKINIHHRKGQDSEFGKNKKTIFIAGMGGREIQEILTAQETSLRGDDRLVISPHRKILELRRFLASSSFHLVSETVVFEEGQFYQILCLLRDPSYPKVSLYGTDLWATEVGRSYRQHQMKFFSEHKDPTSREYFEYLEARIDLN